MAFLGLRTQIETYMAYEDRLKKEGTTLDAWLTLDGKAQEMKLDAIQRTKDIG